MTVLGYDGEPYLRIGPNGVFENVRSPATYLNRSTTITGAPPKSADAKASPLWRNVSSGTTARWHDHRAHFMGGEDPPEVARHPDTRHVVDNWVIPMRVGNQDLTVRGQLVYVPPPSPWPWVVGAVLVAALVFGLSRTRVWRTVFVVALALLTLTEIVHVVGLWDASTASFGTKLGESAYSLAGIALGLLALGWIWRKGTESAVPIVLVATIFLFVAGGLADVTSLGNSQVPSTFSAGFARLVVTLTLGLGAGLAVAAAFRLRPLDARRAHGEPRPSPVELGAPCVVVGLHLDGGVRDVVLEEEVARLVEHAVGVGVGPDHHVRAGDVHLRRERPHVEVVHVDDPRERHQVVADRVEVDVRRRDLEQHAQGARRQSPRAREDPHADDHRRRWGRSGPIRWSRSTTAATITPTEPAASAMAST